MYHALMPIKDFINRHRAMLVMEITSKGPAVLAVISRYLSYTPYLICARRYAKSKDARESHRHNLNLNLTTSDLYLMNKLTPDVRQDIPEPILTSSEQSHLRSPSNI